MPDEDRIFDVTKPSEVNPSATSRPVIVGHHPEMSDPMVKESGQSDYEPPAPTRIPVSDESETENDAASQTGAEETPVAFNPAVVEPAVDPPTEPGTSSEATLAQPSFMAPAAFEPPAAADPPQSVPDTVDTAAAEAPIAAAETTTDQNKQMPHVDELHFVSPKRRGRWPLVAIIVLLILIGAYLAIDSGLIKTGIKLPVHIFKQKNSNTTPTPASSSVTSKTPAAPQIPNGFKDYKIAGTSITFAATLKWGDPTSTAEPGYSQRGGSSQTTGTYAYIVDFATNKDVEIAVTSAKYLPVARTPLYYDYLQWCSGTNNGLIYEARLEFSTDPKTKIDTPTTIVCDQGPVPGAVKIDSTTIDQVKALDTTGKTIGDIYTKNLTDSSLVVFRVKDAAMTNSTTIKQLLNTVQLPSSSSSSSNSGSSQ